MKSKLVKLWGKEEALDIFKKDPGIDLTIKVLSINETAFIRSLIRQALDKKQYEHMISFDELNVLYNKLNTWVSYDAEN